MQAFDMTEDEECKARAAEDILRAYLCLSTDKDIGMVKVCAGQYCLISGNDTVVIAKGMSSFIEGSLYYLIGEQIPVEAVKRDLTVKRRMQSVKEETYGIFVYRMLEYEHWI